MRLLTLTLFSILSLNLFSSQISESVKKCSSQKISNIYKRLKSLENYYQIDKDGYKIGPFIALDMTQSTPVKNHENIYLIALRPVPNHVTSLKASEYPHFFMKCLRSKLSQTSFQLNCKQLTKQKKFTVKDLRIDIVFAAKASKCSNNTSIDVTYKLEIDDQEYETLKSLIKKDLSRKYPSTLVNLIVDRMINSEKFFKGYWRYFFNEWLDFR